MNEWFKKNQTAVMAVAAIAAVILYILYTRKQRDQANPDAEKQQPQSKAQPATAAGALIRTSPYERYESNPVAGASEFQSPLLGECRHASSEDANDPRQYAMTSTLGDVDAQIEQYKHRLDTQSSRAWTGAYHNTPVMARRQATVGHGTLTSATSCVSSAGIRAASDSSLSNASAIGTTPTPVASSNIAAEASQPVPATVPVDASASIPVAAVEATAAVDKTDEEVKPVGALVRPARGGVVASNCGQVVRRRSESRFRAAGEDPDIKQRKRKRREQELGLLKNTIGDPTVRQKLDFLVGSYGYSESYLPEHYQETLNKIASGKDDDDDEAKDGEVDPSCLMPKPVHDPDFDNVMLERPKNTVENVPAMFLQDVNLVTASRKNQYPLLGLREDVGPALQVSTDSNGIVSVGSGFYQPEVFNVGPSHVPMTYIS